MSIFILPVNPAINDIMELNEQLLIAVQTRDEIIFDFQKIESLSTPLLQLFLSLKEHHKNIKLQFINITDEFMSAFNIFGCLNTFKGAIPCQS